MLQDMLKCSFDILVKIVEIGGIVKTRSKYAFNFIYIMLLLRLLSVGKLIFIILIDSKYNRSRTDLRNNIEFESIRVIQCNMSQELLIIYFIVIRFDVKKEIIIITGIYKFQIWSNLW